MTMPTCAPHPVEAQNGADTASNNAELRKKLLEMIRRNEAQRRKTEK